MIDTQGTQSENKKETNNQEKKTQKGTGNRLRFLSKSFSPDSRYYGRKQKERH